MYALVEIKGKQENFLRQVSNLKDIKELTELKKYAKEVVVDLQELYEAVIKGRVERQRPSQDIIQQKNENDKKIAELNSTVKIKKEKRDKTLGESENLNEKINNLIKKDNEERRASIEMEDQLRKKRFEIDKLKDELSVYQINLAKLEVKEDDL